MYRLVIVFVTLLVAVGFGSPLLSAGASQSSQWTTLFDGSDLDAFTPIGDANWSLGDDAVQADSGSGFLVTNESYGDFELKLEFWVNLVAKN